MSLNGKKSVKLSMAIPEHPEEESKQTWQFHAGEYIEEEWSVITMVHRIWGPLG